MHEHGRGWGKSRYHMLDPLMLFACRCRCNEQHIGSHWWCMSQYGPYSITTEKWLHGDGWIYPLTYYCSLIRLFFTHITFPATISVSLATLFTWNQYLWPTLTVAYICCLHIMDSMKLKLKMNTRLFTIGLLPWLVGLTAIFSWNIFFWTAVTISNGYGLQYIVLQDVQPRIRLYAAVMAPASLILHDSLAAAYTLASESLSLHSSIYWDLILHRYFVTSRSSAEKTRASAYREQHYGNGRPFVYLIGFSSLVGVRIIPLIITSQVSQVLCKSND